MRVKSVWLRANANVKLTALDVYPGEKSPMKYFGTCN
jgi:hypothetical protein